MFAASCGVLGLLSAEVSEAVSRFQEWFDIPLLQEHELPTVSDEMLSLVEICSNTSNAAQRLGLHDRGRIQLGAAADLLILRNDDGAISSTGNPWSGLHQVMVAGTVALDGGKVVGGIAGTLLTSHLGNPATLRRPAT